ncbi:MAG: polysaccharide deacetylase family protein [Candidatus Omnitrophica bacterium]|nr:polysaccharide deacetylase family protein [Candidatus Omnitrophota bacterium]
MNTRQAPLIVLNYHAVEAREGEYPFAPEERVYVLPLDIFARQLDEIVRAGMKTLTLEDMSRWLRGEPDTGQPLVLTFDDGHLSHLEHVAGELKKRGLQAVFFVAAGLIGQEGFMDWKQLKELAGGGFEIGSHGFYHIPLTGLSDRELVREIEESKHILQEWLGTEVRSFSVPRGFYHPRIRKIVHKAGYRFLFTSRFDVNPQAAVVGHPAEGARDERQLPIFNRLAVKRDTSMEEFGRFLTGNLGARKYREYLKSLARQVLPSRFYDMIASLKNRPKTQL